MYKTLDYRTTANRNKYVPFGFISPTTLEEQFVFILGVLTYIWENIWRKKQESIQVIMIG